MPPLVSVVIPTFNREHYLRTALDSVMAQTYVTIEVVVVDDGSTDNTRTMIERYGTVRYLYQENQGISKARNTGIKNAQGEFIAFLDSDDYWMPTKTERQIDLFQKNPEYGLVASCCASIREDGSFRDKNRPGKSGWVLEDLFKANFIRTSSAMVKKESIEKVGLFDEDLKECEEYDLWLRIAAEYPIGFINESLAVYLDNLSGVSTDSLAGRLYRLQVLEKQYLAEKITPRLYARRLANTCHYIGRHYFKKGKKEKSLYYLKKAINLHPLNIKNIFYYLLYFITP